MFCLSCVDSRETNDSTALVNDTAFFDWKESTRAKHRSIFFALECPFSSVLVDDFSQTDQLTQKVLTNNNSIAFTKQKKWSSHLSSYWREKLRWIVHSEVWSAKDVQFTRKVEGLLKDLYGFRLWYKILTEGFEWWSQITTGDEAAPYYHQPTNEKSEPHKTQALIA